jgi:Na+-translocating ferredoxin:NAD+ oxidoreductase subunit C
MAEAVRIAWTALGAAPAAAHGAAWEGLSPREVVAAVQDAGVVGLGGAAFPAHVKLVPPKDAKIELLLVNGAECEPYLTTDHRTMVEYPERVHFGARIMMRALGVERARDRRGDRTSRTRSRRCARRSRRTSTSPCSPDGEVSAGRGEDADPRDRPEVPSGKLPVHVGVVVQNVGTIACIAEVFETGLPLIERVVTVTGRGVRRPSNLLVPVGHAAARRARLLRRPHRRRGGDPLRRAR